MIALPQRLPHVIWKNDRLVPLSEGWLAESIEHSAEAAGHHRWHLAPEVARAIAIYLENDWIAPALPVDHLREMLRRSLEGIGFEDIAQESLIVPPRVSISLMELAVRAPYEIEFYPLLKERLGDTRLIDTPDWSRHPDFRPMVTAYPGAPMATAYPAPMPRFERI